MAKIADAKPYMSKEQIPSIVDSFEKVPISTIRSTEPVWLFRPPPFSKESIIMGRVVAKVVVRGTPVFDNNVITKPEWYNRLWDTLQKSKNEKLLNSVSEETFEPSPPPSPTPSEGTSRRSSVASYSSSLADYMYHSGQDWNDYRYHNTEKVDWFWDGESEEEYGYYPCSDDSDYESVN